MFENLKLKTKLIAAFWLVASFSIINSAVAIFLFSEVESEVQTIVDGDINEIQNLLEISSIAKKIEFNLEKLASISDHTKLSLILDNLKSQWIELKNAIKKPGSERYDKAYKFLRSNIDLINKSINQTSYLSIVLFDLVNAKNSSAEIHKALVSQQLSLQSFYDSRVSTSENNRSDIGIGLAQLYIKSSNLSSQLLSAFDLVNDEELRSLKRTSLYLFRKINSISGSLPLAERQFTSNWLTHIKPMVMSNRSIFVALQKERRITDIVGTIIDQKNSMITSVNNNAIATVESLREDIGNHANSLTSRLNLFSNTFIVSSIVCLLCASLIILFFVGKRIIIPMVTLRNAMNNIASGNTKTRLPTGGTDEVAEMFHALSILREHVSQVNLMAQYDSLTGLLNRRQFDSMIESEVRRCKRENNLFTLLICDIDYFKEFNDQYGHQAGDECLKRCAQAIKSHFIRATDSCYRYGGEEFVVSLSGGEHGDALMMAEGLRKLIISLDIAHADSHCSSVITISIGIVSAYPPNIPNYKSVFEMADNAMYQAKDQGRNRVIHTVLSTSSIG